MNIQPNGKIPSPELQGQNQSDSGRVMVYEALSVWKIIHGPIDLPTQTPHQEKRYVEMWPRAEDLGRGFERRAGRGRERRI
jgi:hypothetical protein